MAPTPPQMQAYLQKIRAMVQDQGYIVQGVMDNPPMFYTVGLASPRQELSVLPLESAGLEGGTSVLLPKIPELVLMGLDPEIGNAILHEVAEMLLHGLTLEEGKNYDTVFKGFPARFVRLTAEQIRSHLRIAMVLHKGPDLFDAWQVLWPDPEGRFPGDVGVIPKYAAMQDLKGLE